ncbi:uncharacterized protein LOC142352178 [Convolutriloba macropyga]|uniref:uncharacterized protein LOC142352178 n=1 Tax=Convolutriloba macropyga TaxID=536237 RepID=UPI003F51CE4A
MDCGKLMVILSLVFTFMTALFTLLTNADRIFKCEADVGGNKSECGIGFWEQCHKAMGDDKNHCNKLSKLNGGEFTFANGHQYSFDQYNSKNMSAVATLLVGAILAFINVFLLTFLEFKNCIPRLIILLFASLTLTFLAIGMSMTSYLYSTCPKFMTDEKRDLSKASYSQAHCFMLCPECATVKGTRKAYGTWAYGMGWVGTGFAITTLVLLCLGACCCSGKKEENAGEKEEIVPKNE